MHRFACCFLGCTLGSTDVGQQLKEIKDVPGSEGKVKKLAAGWNQSRPRLEADQSVFKVYKGVKCFDFAKNKNIIVTGGKMQTHT